MTFDEFDNGTGLAIRTIKRDMNLTWLFASVFVGAGVYFTPSMTEGEKGIFAAVVFVGAFILQEVKRARIDILRIERAKLYEDFRAKRMVEEGY